MLQLGHRMQATRILTKIADWDMEEALTYINSLSVDTIKLPRLGSLVSSDDTIREFIMDDDLKGAIDYAKKSRNPFFAWSDEEAMKYIKLLCPDLVK
jgi:hypothetical protein